MKRLTAVFTACLLMAALLCQLSVSAAGNLSMTASATTVTVDKSVTVTLKYDGGGKPIAGIIGNLTYDTNVFSYESFTGTDVQVNGGAGKMRFIFSPTAAQAPTAVTITLTFKAVAPGNCNFALATEEFIDDESYTSLGTPTGNVAVTASNPTLSGNANLKSLVPSKGTLSPKFDPNKTEYTIAVANSVTSLTLSAVAAEGQVTNISGKNALEVGKNTRVITVTAPNGTTKKYTVVITRAAAPSTTTGTNPSTGTTVPLPPEDALDVAVDGVMMTIRDTQAPVALPQGFSWSNLTINHVEVPAAVNQQTGMTLLYLTGEVKENDGFYIYYQEEDSFVRFRSLNAAGGNYLLYDLPADRPLNGLKKDVLVYEGGQVSAYVYDGADLSDFYVVWAAPTGGTTAWYTYDAKEGTFQRYHGTHQEGGTTPTTPSDDHVLVVPKPGGDKVSERHNLLALLGKNQTFLLIGVVALAALVALVLIIAILLSLGGRKKGKH